MIEIKNLSKSFDELVVLDDVSLNIERGKNTVVFGRSGTGKSVLLKCIVRLLEPDSGEIFFDSKNILGLPLKKLNEIRKKIGFLFQGSALYDSMTVRENIEFPLIRNFDFTESEREEKIHKVLEGVSLIEAIDKMPSELSGGMKKRIGLARTIVTEPELILYDEPTTGLDPITTKEISELILEMQKDLNCTSIVVTHDLICAKIIADYAVVLHDGKFKYSGNIKELTSSRDPFLRNFFGTVIFEDKNGSLKSTKGETNGF
jgi:phospholipid/cholesterol/gamma-HCH transport system ATP-binding protein